MKTLGKFIAEIRRKLFAARTEREIHSKILPHLNGRADHGYPFTNRNGLHKARLDGSIGVRNMLVRLDQAARKMPEAEGQAFLYLATRDLNERLEQYLEFAEARANPECSPSLVVKAA